MPDAVYVPAASVPADETAPEEATVSAPPADWLKVAGPTVPATASWAVKPADVAVVIVPAVGVRWVMVPATTVSP